MRWSCPTLVLIWVGALATVANASGPADDLLRLVPVESGVTLVIENLRAHSKEIRESSLFQGLSRLEAVRSWIASDQCRLFERTKKELQAGLGVSIEVFRDEIFGDALILAFQPGPDDRPDQSRGLLLVRPRDRELASRLLKTLNQIQTQSGELDQVEPRTRGALTYMARRFKEARRPPEFYIQLDDGVVAWSNSESMVQAVIDRKGLIGKGLGDDPSFRKVRQGLPEQVLVSLFVNPRFVERLLTDASGSSKSKTPPDRLPTMLLHYLGAMTQLGFAVEWRDGLALHSHEVLDPEKLEPWLKRWLTRPASPSASLAAVPASAVAAFSANIDFEAIGEAARQLIPESDQASFANLKLAAQGMLLGRDPMTWVAPRLGSRVLVYLDVEADPNARPSLPWVAVVGWLKGPGLDDLAGPIDNALRTVFALMAVDSKYRDSKLKIETRTIGDARLTSLTKGGNRTILAYRSDQDRLVLGTSTDAVARFATGSPNSTLAEIRSKYVSEAETYAVVDVQRLVVEVKRLQKPVAAKLAARSKRPVAAAERDLSQLIDLANLFRAFTFSTITAKEATEIHRTIGLIAR